MTYDDWLSTEPLAELGEHGEVECPFCGGAPVERGDDGTNACHECDGRGWFWPEDLVEDGR